MSNVDPHYFPHGDILVVEDNTSDLKFLTNILTKAGYRARPASDGELALRSVEAKLPDLILLDVKMPGMNGVDVCRLLKADPATRDLPVIFISALGETNLKVKALEAGGIDYVTKPIDPLEVLARINTHLNIYRLQQRLAFQSEELIGEIKERKQVEKSLRESEAWLSTTLESIGDAVIATDVGGRVTFMNPVALSLTGCNRQETIGKPLEEVFCIINEESRQPVESPVTKVIRRGIVVGLANHTLLIAKDRTEMPIADSGAPIRDEKGNLIGVVLVFRDIRENKRAEKELRKSEEKYRHLVESTVDWVWSCDIEGRQTFSNKAVEQILGYEVHEINGASAFSLMHPEYRERVHEWMQKAVEEKRGWKGTVTKWRHKDGSLRFLETVAQPILDAEGNLTGFSGIDRDVTDREKAIEEKNKLETKLQQAQKMEAIGTLAGGIAHDFNNILFPIIGFAEMMLDDIPLESPLHGNINQILIGAQRAGDLVKQILTFSRQADRELRPLKVQLIVKEVLKLSRSTLPSTIEIIQNISNNCGLVIADSTQIHQIAMNLITNAYHAMRETGGKLEVTLKEVELGIDDVKGPTMSPGPYACLTVADTGIGMEKPVLDRIFDPYFTTKVKGEGTGLGLSVVHGIVKSFGGDIRVYSETGQGSAFHVYLPVIKTRLEIQAFAPTAPVQKGDEQILLIDDEEQIVRMEKQMLERLGYQVTVRTSSIDALEAFRSDPERFDLVITDMTMPNMTGIQLSIKLREIRPDIPIILCSGFSEQISGVKLEALGIKGYVMKPVVTSELAKKIREVLDQRD